MLDTVNEMYRYRFRKVFTVLEEKEGLTHFM
jgi:hypothetical protein